MAGFGFTNLIGTVLNQAHGSPLPGTQEYYQGVADGTIKITPENFDTLFSSMDHALSPSEWASFSPAVQAAAKANPQMFVKSLLDYKNPYNNDLGSLGAAGGFSDYANAQVTPDGGFAADPSKYIQPQKKGGLAGLGDTFVATLKTGLNRLGDIATPGFDPILGNKFTGAKPIITKTGNFTPDTWKQIAQNGGDPGFMSLWQKGNQIADVIAPMIAGGYLSGAGAAGGYGSYINAGIKGANALDAASKGNWAGALAGGLGAAGGSGYFGDASGYLNAAGQGVGAANAASKGNWLGALQSGYGAYDGFNSAGSSGSAPSGASSGSNNMWDWLDSMGGSGSSPWDSGNGWLDNYTLPKDYIVDPPPMTSWLDSIGGGNSGTQDPWSAGGYETSGGSAYSYSPSQAQQIADAWTQNGVPMTAAEAQSYLDAGGTGIGATSDPSFWASLGGNVSNVGTGLLNRVFGTGSGSSNGGSPLGALLGGLLGSSSGGSKQAGTTTTTVTPWAGQQPYLLDMFNRASQQANTGGVPNSAQMKGLDTLGIGASGPAVNPMLGLNNPYLTKAINDASDDAMRNLLPAQHAADAASGSFGNSGVAETYGRAAGDQLGKIATSARMQDYTNQQQLYQNAVGNTLNSANNLYSAGTAQQQLPWQNLKNYGSVVTGNYGSNTSTPYFTNPTANGLGGALLGSQIGKSLGL